MGGTWGGVLKPSAPAAEAAHGHVSAWDVSAVTNMNYMFSLASEFNQPLASFDTSSVTDMGSMFSLASAFNQPIDDWDVE